MLKIERILLDVSIHRISTHYPDNHPSGHLSQHDVIPAGSSISLTETERFQLDPSDWVFSRCVLHDCRMTEQAGRCNFNLMHIQRCLFDDNLVARILGHETKFGSVTKQS